MSLTDVELVLSARYSSQRQLRLGLELLVCWLPLFLENGSKDLHETWHDCRDRYSKKTDESFFREKFVNP